MLIGLQDWITATLTSERGVNLSIGAGGVLVGWGAKIVQGWWSRRDRYRAHVTWRSVGTRQGPEDFPVLVIQSIHNLPINVIGLRLRNGFRWRTALWAYDSDDPDYPDLPRAIEPLKETMFVLNLDGLQKAAAQSWLLNWLWVPRVYVGIRTLGRGEVIVAAERGLKWNERRKRYRG